MTEKETLHELSISVACLLDNGSEEMGGYKYITTEEKDIHHIQDLITRLEYEQWKRDKENEI
jgi:hypothetical protein